MAKTLDMTSGKPTGLLVRFGVPLMLGSILQFMYNLVDSIVVGRLIGVEGFAAVGAAGFFYWLMFDVIIGFTQGWGTILAQRFGANDERGHRAAFSMSLLLTIGLGTVLTVVSLLLTYPVLGLLNTPADIIDNAALYLYVMFSGLIVAFFYRTLSTALYATGDTKTPLVAMVISTLINIALDYILVAFTPLGVAGVALATVLAQAFSCFYCYRQIKTLPCYRLRKNDFRLDKASLFALMRLGGPMGFRNFAISLGGLVIQYFVNGYGVNFIAGVTLANKMLGLLQIVAGAVDEATATFVAQNYGARNLPRIRHGVNTARNMMLCSSLVIAVLVLLLGRSLLSLFFAGDAAQIEQVLDVGQLQLSVMACALPLLCLLYTYRSAIQGMGNALIPTLAGFVELGTRILAVGLLPLVIGEWGVYLSMALGWLTVAVFCMVSYRVVYRKKLAALT